MNRATNQQDLQELKSLLLQGVRTVKPHAAKCLEGTRTSILAGLDIKTNDCDGPNIIHIYGAPGSGKSSISLTSKSRLHRQRRLVTYFRFDRNEATTTTTTSLWCHVAYDLARLFPSVLSYLLEQLRDDEVELDSPMDIFTSLVENPLSKIADPVDRPLVIIIDALDECGGFAGRPSSDRQMLLQTLIRWAALPKHFKLLVTSRPEADIIQALSSVSTHIDIPSGHLITENPGAKVSIETLNDIQMLLEERFKIIRQIFLLPADWPGPPIVGDMIRRAGGIFMWATTAANFIESGIDPRGRLQMIIDDVSDPSTMKPLYSLYSIVLEMGFGQIPGGSLEAEMLQSVLATMVLAKRPLDDLEYTKLPTTKPITEYMLNGIRDRLRSVIAPGNLRFIHKSFDDFLLSEECPPKYAIRKDNSHYLLTKLCLTTMREGLCFNICSLETSCLKNADVPDIATKVASGITPLLSYSCIFFADHLVSTPFDEDLVRQVQVTMLDKLLFWFEVMSLLGEINRVSPSLLLTIKWLHISPNDEFKDFLHDARRFIGSFGVPIAESAPHIYLSALPFAPENSSIARHFLPQFPCILTFSTGKLTNWPSCIFSLEHHIGRVNCVAFSADEEYFVTGSDDQTISVFDSTTGNLTSGPFGCDGEVKSVCFDPADRQVLAGCKDGKMSSWDLETGNKHLVSCPHDPRWLIVAPDLRCRFNGGQKIISASMSIKLWNRETGICEQDCEHDWDVNGAASISLDGCYIAVPRHGRMSITIWKFVNGSKIQGPVDSHPRFIHPHPISALSFSVDSKFVVTGSENGTVLIWDASTGDTAGPLISAGSDPVSAVAYTPNNHLLTSISATVTVWNATTGELLGQLEGHTSRVVDITLSRDGQRVLTASWDKTVRMWDLGRKGVGVGTNVNQMHALPVIDVAFSPCGAKLASLDLCSMQAWDMNTGKSLFKCDKGIHHRKLIFSPDGTKIVVYSSPGHRGFAVWDANTGEIVSQFDLRELDSYTSVDHVAFRSTDGVLVILSYSGHVFTWSGEDGVRPELHDKFGWPIALSPNGLTAIVCDHEREPPLCLWHTTNQPPPPVLADNQYVTGYPMAYSPSGQFLASFDKDGCTIRVWNMRTGELAVHFSTIDRAISLAFSPDDRHIAIGYDTSSIREQIRIFDACTGQFTSGQWSGHTKSILTLAFSPDGKTLASGSSDCQVRVWNITDRLGDSQLTIGNLGVGTHMENSWVKDVDGKLFFWVPNDHRARLVWPNSMLVGESEAKTELDLSRFRYGESWTECCSWRDSSS